MKGSMQHACTNRLQWNVQFHIHSRRPHIRQTCVLLPICAGTSNARLHIHLCIYLHILWTTRERARNIFIYYLCSTKLWLEVAFVLAQCKCRRTTRTSAYAMLTNMQTVRLSIIEIVFIFVFVRGCYYFHLNCYVCECLDRRVNVLGNRKHSKCMCLFWKSEIHTKRWTDIYVSNLYVFRWNA